MAAASDIERLIELGLNRYGAGDLDGAILLWEEALTIEPENARAASYLEYVNLNYEMLANAQPTVSEGDDSFAIEEEPEYHITLTPGDLPRAESAPAVEDVDSGWFEETQGRAGWFEGETASDGRLAEPLELEAEPPPLPPTIEAREPDEDETARETNDGINFEDATREYHHARKAGLPLAPPSPADFADTGTGEFAADETTGGFRHESTPLGFGSELATEVRKRDLGFVQPTGDDDATNARPRDKVLDVLGEKTFDEGAFGFEATGDDLIATKPRISRPQAETQDTLREGVTKREMLEPQPPAATPRGPTRRDSAELSQAEVMLTAQTRKLELELTGAPTRDLGLRPKPLLTNPDDEELPTKQSDVRAIRAAQVVFDERQETRQDLVLAFDPISARSDQILADVDQGAPAIEPTEDQTRRRIGTLLERALTWSQAGDVDRAVAAVDLAMSEDPNSVLAQKLITRNRDTIMAIFQSFIGAMDRQPQLTSPLHELQNAPISPRAAFLLSRIDGTLTIDELLDVSGMPRMEAYRHLCQLFLRGILR